MESYVKEFQGKHEKESEIVVTIDGPSGAGKGTAADFVSKKLAVTHFSASDVFYSIAEERGISHVELAEKADKSVDLEVDRRTLERGLSSNCVIDSRIASWVLGDYADLRIHLTADLEERARRIAKREDVDLEEAREETEKRDEENTERYMDYYGVETSDLGIYHLVLDNTKLSIQAQEEILGTVLRERFSERVKEVESMRE